MPAHAASRITKLIQKSKIHDVLAFQPGLYKLTKKEFLQVLKGDFDGPTVDGYLRLLARSFSHISVVSTFFSEWKLVCSIRFVYISVYHSTCFDSLQFHFI